MQINKINVYLCFITLPLGWSVIINLYIASSDCNGGSAETCLQFINLMIEDIIIGKLQRVEVGGIPHIERGTC